MHVVGKVNDLPIGTKVVEHLCQKHGKVKCTAFVLCGEIHSFCPLCEREREEQEEKERRQKELEYAREAFEAEMKERNIELEFWTKSIADYKAQCQEQSRALACVKRMIAQKTGKIIILGSNGVGKTMLGSIAVKELGGKILSMYELSGMIRHSYKDNAERDEFEIVNELASIPLLVIDEMGRTKGSEAEMNWLSYILDKRHVRRLPFMLLANTHLKRDCKAKGCRKCFENYVDNDVLSRLRQDTEIITIIAPDYRAGK